MIVMVQGDLLDVTKGTIVHGVNCQGIMGSGVALAIKKKYPIVFEKYREHVITTGMIASQQRILLGTLFAVPVTEELTVINAFTQINYGATGKHASYDAIDEAAERLARSIGMDVPIAMPKIGTGYGGLSWSVVHPILYKHLRNHNVQVLWK